MRGGREREAVKERGGEVGGWMTSAHSCFLSPSLHSLLPARGQDFLGSAQVAQGDQGRGEVVVQVAGRHIGKRGERHGARGENG